MRKIVESTFMTLDGVISDPGVWGRPYWDEDHAGYATKLMEPAGALLLGRDTYEGFAAAWPSRGGEPFTDKINDMPKYVASTTLREATWNATILQGDVVEEVRKLKQQNGGDILKYGTGSFSRTLLEHKLVDEYHFWMFPIVGGKGTRLFEGAETQTQLKLIDSVRFPSGIVVMVYAPK